MSAATHTTLRARDAEDRRGRLGVGELVGAACDRGLGGERERAVVQQAQRRGAAAAAFAVSAPGDGDPAPVAQRRSGSGLVRGRLRGRLAQQLEDRAGVVGSRRLAELGERPRARVAGPPQVRAAKRGGIAASAQGRLVERALEREGERAVRAARRARGRPVGAHGDCAERRCGIW